MKKLFTLLTVTALALAGRGVAFGQAYIGNGASGISTGNNNANGTAVSGAQGVNNEFGAGETAIITGAGFTGPGNVTFPGTSRAVQNTSPVALLLGSSTVSGQNIVINSYNAGGNIQGWVCVWVGKNSCLTSFETNRGSWPTAPTCNPVQNINNVYNDADFNGTGTSYGNAVRPYTYTYTGDGCAPSISGTINLSAWRTFAPYVSNTNVNDNGIPLVQTINNAVKDDASFAAISAPKTAGNGLELYVRPTTVAIGNVVAFDEFKVKPIQWWYNTYGVSIVSASPSSIASDDCYSNVTYTSYSHDYGGYTDGLVFIILIMVQNMTGSVGIMLFGSDTSLKMLYGRKRKNCLGVPIWMQQSRYWAVPIFALQIILPTILIRRSLTQATRQVIQRR